MSRSDLRKKFEALKEERQGVRASEYKEPKKKGQNVVLFIFGSVFFGFGAFFIVMMFGPLISGMVVSQTWVATPCTITKSHLESSSSSDGSTYKIDITFSYTYSNRSYNGGSYDFTDFNSSGRKGKQKVLNQYPVGKKTSCWVNPNDPNEAVLYRGPSWSALFILLPMVFMAIGGACMYGAIFKRNTDSDPLGDSAKKVDWLPNAKYELAAGGIVLKPASSRFGKLLGVMLFAVVWNGIVSIMVYKVVESHMKNDAEWFLTFFAIPFVLVGLGAFVAVVHQFLALFNPKIELRLDTGEIYPGQTLNIRWQVLGANTKLSQVTIDMVGQESATYTRGTDTVTDTHEFFDETLYDSETDGRVPPGGQFEVTLPADAMHSFDASNNKVKWYLQVHGDIPKWPDIKNTYPIIVAPHGMHVEDDQ